jgi:hypothetical protein
MVKSEGKVGVRVLICDQHGCGKEFTDYKGQYGVHLCPECDVNIIDGSPPRQEPEG